MFYHLFSALMNKVVCCELDWRTCKERDCCRQWAQWYLDFSTAHARFVSLILDYRLSCWRDTIWIVTLLFKLVSFSNALSCWLYLSFLLCRWRYFYLEWWHIWAIDSVSWKESVWNNQFVTSYRFFSMALNHVWDMKFTLTSMIVLSLSLLLMISFPSMLLNLYNFWLWKQ